MHALGLKVRRGVGSTNGGVEDVFLTGYRTFCCLVSAGDRACRRRKLPGGLRLIQTEECCMEILPMRCVCMQIQLDLERSFAGSQSLLNIIGICQGMVSPKGSQVCKAAALSPSAKVELKASRKARVLRV